MTEGQVLKDAIDIRWPDHSSLSDGPAAFGTFVGQQVPFASASAHDFASAGDLEALSHGFPGFNSFGASHSIFRKLRSVAAYGTLAGAR
jgi:hypothetical protein